MSVLVACTLRRLAIVSSAYRLGLRGREAQAAAAAWARAGRPRRGSAALMALLGSSPVSRRVLFALGWATGPMFLGDDPDMLATLDAEDTFDLRDRLTEITVPTLVVAGARDPFYSEGLFRETAALPGTRRSAQTSRWSEDGNGKVPVSRDSGSACTGQKTPASVGRRSLDGST